MEENRGEYSVLVEKPEGRRPFERPRRRWEDNIKMNLRDVRWRPRTGSIWLRIGTVVGSCECGNELSGSIKCREFLEWRRTCQLLRENSVPWQQLLVVVAVVVVVVVVVVVWNQQVSFLVKMCH
jgi:hypothetical protein